jgi:hypothetical protein
MSQTQITIQLNPIALSRRLDRALQRAEHLVRIGLNVPDPDLGELEVPDRQFHFGIEAFPMWDPQMAKHEFSRCVLTNGFRDIAEAIANVLEEFNRVASMIALVDEFGGASALRVAEWENACDTAARRFHGFGLPVKLARLSSQFGIRFLPRLERQLVSINATRNCLVHRDGFVGERDVDATQRLTVHYRHLFFAIGPLDSPTEVTLPYRKQDSDNLRMSERDETKSFVLGEQVFFDSTEFGDLCWTLHRFGASMAEVMLQYCRAHGVGIPDAPTA